MYSCNVAAIEVDQVSNVRWIKHMTTTADDEKVASYIEIYRKRRGLDGALAAYGFWWLLLERIASQIGPGETKYAVTYSWHRWCVHLFSTPKGLRSYLGSLQEVRLIKLHTSGDDATIEIHNLLKYRDEYSKKSRHKKDKTPTESGDCQAQDTEGETHTEIETNNVELKTIKEVFSYWQVVLNHPKAKLDDKRKGKITRALKLYSFADVCLAIDGCAATPYNMGQNEQGQKYDDIELILRDSIHTERFIENAQNPPTKLIYRRANTKMERAIKAVGDKFGESH